MCRLNELSVVPKLCSHVIENSAYEIILSSDHIND